MPTKDPDDFWRKEVNSLGSDLPEEGSASPDIETIKPKPRAVRDGNKKVTVQKITTRIYVLTDLDGKTATSNVSQRVDVIGTMLLSRAVKIIQEDSST